MQESHELHEFQVKVAYNGAVYEASGPLPQASEAVFHKALVYFELQGSGGGNLALYFNGMELNLQQPLSVQGVPSGATVMLQPRVVRNG